MKKIYLFIYISLLFFSLKAAAQEYTVPKHYAFKSNQDYITYEPEVVKAIDWLEKTPWAEQVKKRDEAKAFVLRWIDGSPEVSITLNSEVAQLAKNNPQLLGSYMYGYAKYAILHKSDFSDTKAKAAGVKGLLDKYTTQTNHKQNDEVEKVIAINKDNKLDNWIITYFNSH
jgi:hypothetical protein